MNDEMETELLCGRCLVQFKEWIFVVMACCTTILVEVVRKSHGFTKIFTVSLEALYATGLSAHCDE